MSPESKRAYEGALRWESTCAERARLAAIALRAGLELEARLEHRETLAAMSDEAIRYQLENGATGGIQREEIVREATERIRRRRDELTTPLERIAFDNDPSNGPTAIRILAMTEERS